jgi:hypothetical protein
MTHGIMVNEKVSPSIETEETNKNQTKQSSKIIMGY